MNTRSDVVSSHLVALVLAGVAALLGFLYLVGYRAIVDDVFYVYAANQWLIDPPHYGHTHWEMRIPYVSSMAVSYALFGHGNWQTALPGILSFALLIYGSYYFFSRFYSQAGAIIVTVVILFSPAFFLNSSYITPDLMEVLFVAASVFFFIVAAQNPKHVRTWLIVSGVAAGLAMSTRFTSAGLLFFYALLFLVWPQIKRMHYGFLLLGFVPIFSINLVISQLEADDPLYRVSVAKSQQKPTKDFSVFTQRDDMGKPQEVRAQSIEREFRPETLGPLAIPKGLVHYTALVSNHEYGVLFLVLIPSISIVLLSGRLSRGERRVVVLLGFLALSWFVFATYVLGLRAHPRYYVVTAFGGAVWVGTALLILIRHRLFLLAGLATASMVGANLAFASLDGTDLFEEKRLMRIIKSNPDELVHVFPETMTKARYFLEAEDLSGAVSTDLTPPGGLFFFTPPDQYKFDPNVLPPESWEPIEPYQRRQTIIGKLVSHANLANWFGAYIADRLSYSSPGSGLYRIPLGQPGMTMEQRDYLGRKRYNLTN